MRGILIFLSLFIFPAHTAFAEVFVSEIAWMGTAASANDEWIELGNSGSSAVDIEGFTFGTEDGGIHIALAGSISAGGFYLLERTDDNTVGSVAADIIYTGALSNAGEIMILKDASGNTIERLDFSGGWAAGDNETKDSMQKIGGAWATGIPTPRALNSSQPSSPPSSDGDSPPAENTYEPDAPSAPSGHESSSEKEPNIEAEAGAPERRTVAGARLVFEGSAKGLLGEPLYGADMSWNFGDGAVERGSIVSHTYNYEGIYTVNFTVSNGKYFDSDRVVVHVSPLQASLSDDGRRVIVFNESSHEFDISDWILLKGDAAFRIPPHTTVLAGMSASFSYETIRFSSGSSDTTALLYPNGAEALRAPNQASASSGIPPLSASAISSGAVSYEPAPSLPLKKEELSFRAEEKEFSDEKSWDDRSEAAEDREENFVGSSTSHAAKAASFSGDGNKGGFSVRNWMHYALIAGGIALLASFALIFGKDKFVPARAGELSKSEDDLLAEDFEIIEVKDDDEQEGLQEEEKHDRFTRQL
ncbi:lamin tail domain-containing protein [bacterium]|nr:lamin tail domain-containing protein [bacterium]